MGNKTSTCYYYTSNVPRQVREFKGNPGQNISFAYNVSGCNRIDTAWNNVTIPYIQVYKPKPNSTLSDYNRYDTNSFCKSNSDCKINDVPTDPNISFYDDKQVLGNYSTQVADGNGGSKCEDHDKRSYISLNNKGTVWKSTEKNGVYVKTSQTTFKGEFDKSLIAGDETTGMHNEVKPINIKRNIDTLVTYHTIDDLYFFCDSIFNDWLYLVQQESSLNVILQDIKNTINSNPSLIMLNRVNNSLRDITTEDNVSTYVDLPFGPPCFSINSVFTLPFKLYHADHTVKTIDETFSKYYLNNLHCNVINSVTGNTKRNYLDKSFDMVSKLGEIDPNKVIAITIPQRGSNLYDVVSDNTKMSDNIVRQVSPNDVTISGNTIPSQIVLSFKPLDAMTVENYYLLHTINVPIYSFSKNLVDFNTLSNGDNKVYIYVAKPDKALGSYIPSIEQNQLNETIVQYMKILYDGNETKATPMMLVKRIL